MLCPKYLSALCLCQVQVATLCLSAKQGGRCAGNGDARIHKQRENKGG